MAYYTRNSGKGWSAGDKRQLQALTNFQKYAIIENRNIDVSIIENRPSAIFKIWL